MEVPSESFHRSSWDSRTCYPRRAFNQEKTDGSPMGWQVHSLNPNPWKSSYGWITVVPAPPWKDHLARATGMERILKVTKKSGNRERCRKLSLWNRFPVSCLPLVILSWKKRDDQKSLQWNERYKTYKMSEDLSFFFPFPLRSSTFYGFKPFIFINFSISRL